MKKGIVRNWAYKSPNEPYGDLGITNGQNFGGYLGGVIIERTSDYKPVGHIANARTFPYHVRYGIVDSLTEDAVREAALQLEIEGCRFIASGGGALGMFQKAVADAVELPTYMTPLMQLKWIRIALRSSETVLILSDLCEKEAEAVFAACGIDEAAYSDCVYMQTQPRTMDADSVLEYLEENDVIANNNIKAVLLDTQLFAGREEDLKQRFGINVWDMKKLMGYVSKAVGQKPRHGFL